MVTAMDDAIGEIISMLAMKGMFEDTLFIFTAGMSFFAKSSEDGMNK